MNEDSRLLAPLTDSELKSHKGAPIMLAPHGIPVLPIPKEANTSQISIKGKKPTLYPYRNREGDILFYSARINTTQDDGSPDKIIRPVCWWRYNDGQEAWSFKQPLEENRPLLNLPKIISHPDKIVFVGEGEKVACSIVKLFPYGIPTTSSGGSKAAHKTDWSVVRGRDVRIILDFDQAGIQYGRDVYTLCKAAEAASIKALSMDIFAQYAIENGQVIERSRDLAKGLDLADVAEESWTAELIQELQGQLEAQGKSLFHEVQETAVNDEETDQECFVRLALLSRVDYDRVRKSESKRLGITLATLDAEMANLRLQSSSQERAEPSILFPEIDPWSEPVKTEDVLNEVVMTVNRFAILPEHADTALALWIVFTGFIDSVDVAPILALSSPEKQCGKTTVLSIVSNLAHKTIPASNITAAALFRTIDAYHPTLIIDEADSFLANNEELRGILNSGHTRPTAFVIRTIGDNHEPKQFSTWGAKAIALIGNLPETLHDRSIVVELRRKLSHEKTEKLRYAGIQTFMNLQRKLLRLSRDHGHLIKGSRPNLPPNISDRAADNWEPLLAIAGLAGKEWEGKAYKAAESLSSRRKEALPIGNQLLVDIEQVFHNKGVERISTADLIEELCQNDESPWSTFNFGKRLTPRQLSKQLKPYLIQSKTVRLGSGTIKGFEKTQFKDAWTRYITSSSGMTHIQSEHDYFEVKEENNVQGGCGEIKSANDQSFFSSNSSEISGYTSQPGENKDISVTDSHGVTEHPKNPLLSVTENSRKTAGCDGVTDATDFLGLVEKNKKKFENDDLPVEDF